MKNQLKLKQIKISVYDNKPIIPTINVDSITYQIERINKINEKSFHNQKPIIPTQKK